MTTEEIDKAAKWHTQFIPNGKIRDLAVDWFVIGALYLQDQSREKNTWKSIDEKLPEVEEKPFYIAAKFLSGDITAWIIYNQEDIDRLKGVQLNKPIYTQWKKIE